MRISVVWGGASMNGGVYWSANASRDGTIQFDAAGPTPEAALAELALVLFTALTAGLPR